MVSTGFVVSCTKGALTSLQATTLVWTEIKLSSYNPADVFSHMTMFLGGAGGFFHLTSTFITRLDGGDPPVSSFLPRLVPGGFPSLTTHRSPPATELTGWVLSLGAPGLNYGSAICKIVSVRVGS